MTKSKKKKRVKFKIKNIIILLGIFSLLVLIGYFVVMLPINNIYISGNNILDDREIMAISNIDDYPSFILTNRYEMKKKLVANSYIEDVIIKKKLGNILEIELVEYKAIAIDSKKEIVLSSGEILENSYNIYDVPILVNDISDKEVFSLFVSKMGLLNSDILRQISEIEYSPVEVDKERFLFYMSDGNFVYISLTKLSKLDKYNEIKDKLNGKKGTIYLDSGDYVELFS